MINQNKKSACDMGMVGLGVMGRNLLMNMSDHGFTVAGFDKDKNKVASLQNESKEKIKGATTVIDFINLLQTPRAIMLLVPAGKIVDEVIEELIPHLAMGDLIIDAGNSHFTDTNRRLEYLQKKGIQFLGVGISGGEEGARRGPSIMPGGAKNAYEKVRPIFEAVSAKVNNQPCVTYLGTGSVGHYVKMVHNGIEYGIMQLIAETYDVMKRGLGLRNDECAKIFHLWNDSELGGYLIEITGKIFEKRDEKTNTSLIDEIRAIAKQNGTGMWTSQSAMELQLPIPGIDLAVSMRDLSVYVKEREQAAALYPRSTVYFNGDRSLFLSQLQNALLIGMIIVYAQGLALLKIASDHYRYNLDLEAVARIWRGGCIIRSKLLDDIAASFHLDKSLDNLLLDYNLSKKILSNQMDLRHIISEVSVLGIPIPVLMSTLSYFDAYRSAWLPANLIQAQRDFFGSHTYERIDMSGSFHTEWE